MKIVKEVYLQTEDISEAIRMYINFLYKEEVDTVGYNIVTDPATNRLVVASAVAKLKV